MEQVKFADEYVIKKINMQQKDNEVPLIISHKRHLIALFVNHLHITTSETTIYPRWKFDNVTSLIKQNQRFIKSSKCLFTF